MNRHRLPLLQRRRSSRAAEVVDEAFLTAGNERRNGLERDADIVGHRFGRGGDVRQRQVAVVVEIDVAVDGCACLQLMG